MTLSTGQRSKIIATMPKRNKSKKQGKSVFSYINCFIEQLISGKSRRGSTTSKSAGNSRNPPPQTSTKKKNVAIATPSAAISSSEINALNAKFQKIRGKVMQFT